MYNLLGFANDIQLPETFWNIVVWVVIGLAAVAALVALIIIIIKIAKMQPDERKRIIVQFLVGLVTYAESYFTGNGRGVEKLQWVEDQFNSRAPWFLKVILMVVGKNTFEELVEEALKIAKTTLWDAAKEK